MSLKTQLDDPNSTLRQFFAERLPGSPATSRDYRRQLVGAETIVPDLGAGRPPWSVLGHAISARLLWELRPESSDTIAGITMSLLPGGVAADVGVDLAHLATHAPSSLTAGDAAMVSWVAGLVDLIRRTGRFNDPHVVAIESASTWGELRGVVPQAWLDDVTAMTEASVPLLAAHKSPHVVIAPTFAGSVPIGGADADYITAEGVLVDIKAKSDPKFKGRDLQQLISYALLDWDDAQQINAVALLMTRQGRLLQWDLAELLTLTARGVVDIADLREDLRARLGSAVA